MADVAKRADDLRGLAQCFRELSDSATALFALMSHDPGDVGELLAHALGAVNLTSYLADALEGRALAIEATTPAKET